jgi:hypothetical protein
MLHIGNLLFGYADPDRKILLRHFVQPPVKAEAVSGRFFFFHFPVPVHFRYGHSFPILKNRQGRAEMIISVPIAA